MKKTLTIISLLAAAVSACSGSNRQKIFDPNQAGQYGGVPLAYQNYSYSSSRYGAYGQSYVSDLNSCVQSCRQSAGYDQQKDCYNACYLAYYGAYRGIPMNQSGQPMIGLSDVYGYSGRMTQWGTQNYPLIMQQFGLTGSTPFMPMSGQNQFMLPYQSQLYRGMNQMNGVCPRSVCTGSVNSGLFYGLGQYKSAMDQYAYCLENNVPYTGQDYTIYEEGYDSDILSDLENLGKATARELVGSVKGVVYGLASNVAGSAIGAARSLRLSTLSSMPRQQAMGILGGMGRGIHFMQTTPNPVQACDYREYRYDLACPQR